MAEQETVGSGPALGRARATGYPEALDAVRSGRNDEAIPVLRRVLAAEPEHIDARVLLGGCLADVGESGAAEGMLRSAVALDPVKIDARLRLGELLVELGRPREALGEYRAVLTVDPDHPTARARVVDLSDSRA